MTTNVRLMGPIFSNVAFLSESLGNPKFSQCPTFPGFHAFPEHLGTPKAAKMTPKSVPELPKLIFGQIAYFVARANENPTVCTLKPSKIIKTKAKMPATHGPRKRKSSKVDFWRLLMMFGVPSEGRKSSKIEKRRSKTRSKKKKEKKRQ